MTMNRSLPAAPRPLYECAVCHKKLRSNPLSTHKDPQTGLQCIGSGHPGVALGAF